MKLKTKSENPNYLAQVVKLANVRKHTNADRLQCVTVQGNNVITGLDAKDGDLYIYFPIECAINGEYLSWSNSFSSPEMNADVKVKGFFSKHGRVKTMSLRGERSMGYIVPLRSIIDWMVSKGETINPSDVGEIFEENKDFDTIEWKGDDILLCEKYVNQEALRKLNNAEKNKNKKVKRESKIVPNQFRVAADTEQLKRNMQKINPNDIISIGYKMHGCNMSMGRVLCKRPLGLFERLLKRFGVNINDNQYDVVYASRRVVKNEFADNKEAGSYYDFDVWSLMAKKYGDALKDGVVLYGEVVNQGPNGGWIQGSYDYGLPEKTCDFYAYRGTIVNASGDVFEMTWPQLEVYCRNHGIPTVPVFYYGKAKDWDKTISTDDHWHENMLLKLMEVYNEKDCFMCKNVVPEEGVVISKEGDTFQAFKLKSFKFLKKESDDLDKGEVNMEDAESN